MSKKQLAAMLSEAHPELGLSKSACKTIVDSLLGNIVTIVKSEGACRLPGFVTFQLYPRQERAGKHPRTGEPITVPASVGVRTKISSDYKDAVQDYSFED